MPVDLRASGSGLHIPFDLNPADLERAFGDIREDWWQLGRSLGQDASADLAHAPTASANISDLGLMLAVTRLVDEMARSTKTINLVCDDPWLFRHLAVRQGVASETPPDLLVRAIKLWLRGYAARGKVALSMMRANLRLRFQRRAAKQQAGCLLVYGHPSSTTDGLDGYFGDLMQHLPSLQRVLHVDCPPDRVLELAGDNRTTSLHAWGSPGRAVLLVFAKWRPRIDRAEQNAWLVRRAAAHEGGTGSAAMIAWQNICQGRWLEKAHPLVVAWPWENHGWERTFVRQARRAGTRTIGYQHSVVGGQINLSCKSNADGANSLPDHLHCNGASGLEQLRDFGHSDERLEIAGALRFSGLTPIKYNPDGPVFVAVPFDGETGKQMVDACKKKGGGHKFLVKEHPMTPLFFEESETVTRTGTRLDHLEHGVSAVIFAATTVGLEAWLNGVPCVRFLPRGKIALNILPENIAVPVADEETLGGVLEKIPRLQPTASETIFAPVDYACWRHRLEGEAHDGNT